MVSLYVLTEGLDGKCSSFISYEALLIGCNSYPRITLIFEGAQGLMREYTKLYAEEKSSLLPSLQALARCTFTRHGHVQ